MINTVPMVIVTQDHLVNSLGEGEAVSCPICLSELTVGDEARILLCKHMFHKQVYFIPRCLVKYNSANLHHFNVFPQVCRRMVTS